MAEAAKATEQPDGRGYRPSGVLLLRSAASPPAFEGWNLSFAAKKSKKVGAVGK